MSPGVSERLILPESQLSRADNGVPRGLTVVCAARYAGSMRSPREVTGRALRSRRREAPRATHAPDPWPRATARFAGAERAGWRGP